MKVTTSMVQLYAFSLPGYNLPTFQKARLKTVRIWRRTIAKYLMFIHYSTGMQEIKEYIRVK